MAGQRVLLVDDDDAIRQLVAAVIRRYGIVCDFAADGVEALDRLAAHPYALVILDLMMPRMDGFEVMQELRLRGIRVPVVVATAAGQGKVSRLDPVMVKAVLQKPFEVAHLVDTIIGLCAANDPFPAEGKAPLLSVSDSP